MRALRSGLVAAAMLVALACASRERPVTVAQLLARPPEPVVVAGRAENVQPHLPSAGPSGITFRLTDGTGSIQVVHEGTLTLRDGTLVQVRGTRQQEAGEPPVLLASAIWIVGAGAPP